jgi:hypothetical protein
MKNLFVALVFLSCFLMRLAGLHQNQNTIADFMGDAVIVDPGLLNENEPIVSLLGLAKEKASKTSLIKKENINALLAEAQQSKYAFIVVGKHTIVRITDFDDCKKSTSWGADMPYGKALVQKNGLNEKKDYINNIIGVPDNQPRWLLLFN